MDSATQAQYAYKAVTMKDGLMKSSTSKLGDKDGQEDVDELSGFNPTQALKRGAAVLAAGVTIAANAAALAIFGGPLLITTTAVATGASVTVAYRELTMDDIDTVREATQLIREQVNIMAHENNRLTGEVDRLEQGTFTLKETEGHLKEITGQQDLNVKNLVNLCHINQKILDEKQKLVRQDVVASVVDAVLKADIDDSGDFSAKEVRRMINYIKGLPSVEIDERKLQKALAKDKSVASIIDIVNDLGCENTPKERRIFILNFQDNSLAKSVVARQEEEAKKKKAKKKAAKKGSKTLSPKPPTRKRVGSDDMEALALSPRTSSSGSRKQPAVDKLPGEKSPSRPKKKKSSSDHSVSSKTSKTSKTGSITGKGLSRSMHSTGKSSAMDDSRSSRASKTGGEKKVKKTKKKSKSMNEGDVSDSDYSDISSTKPKSMKTKKRTTSVSSKSSSRSRSLSPKRSSTTASSKKKAADP